MDKAYQNQKIFNFITESGALPVVPCKRNSVWHEFKMDKLVAITAEASDYLAEELST